MKPILELPKAGTNIHPSGGNRITTHLKRHIYHQRTWSHESRGPLCVAAILITLIVLHIGIDWYILKRDNVFFESDVASVYTQTDDLLYRFPKENLVGKIGLLQTVGSPYPSFYLSIGAVFLSVFGMRQDVAVMTNAPFIAVLIVSTYLLGRRLGSTGTGLLSAVLVQSFPAVLSMSRTYKPHFALIGMVSFSILLLLESDHMRRRGTSIALGVILGLTALTNPTFSLFLIGPFMSEALFPLINAVRARKAAELRNILLNIMIAASLCALIALPWYAWNVKSVMTESEKGYPQSLFGKPQGVPNLSFEHIAQLSSVIGLVTLKPMLYLFFAASLYLVFIHKRYRFLLLSWILAPYLGFVILGLNDDFLSVLRNHLSVAPAVALVIALGVTRVSSMLQGRDYRRRKLWCYLLPAAVSLACALLFLHITFRGSGNAANPLGPALEGWERNVMSNLLGRMGPYRHAFDMEQTAEAFERELANRESTPVIFILYPFGIITDGLMRSELKREHGRRHVGFETTQCIDEWEGSGERDLSLHTPRAKGLDGLSCLDKLERSDYALIEEPKGILLEEWKQFEALGPKVLSGRIGAEMTNQTIFYEFKFESGPEILPIVDSNIPVPPEFIWGNFSAVILKRDFR